MSTEDKPTRPVTVDAEALLEACEAAEKWATHLRNHYSPEAAVRIEWACARLLDSMHAPRKP